jgi:hypothetical protein
MADLPAPRLKRVGFCPIDRVSGELYRPDNKPEQFIVWDAINYSDSIGRKS